MTMTMTLAGFSLGVHPMDIHLISVYLMGVHLMACTSMLRLLGVISQHVPYWAWTSWARTSWDLHLMGPAPHWASTSWTCTSWACTSWVCITWACTSLGLHFLGVHLMGVRLMGVVCLEAFRFFNLGFLGKVLTPHHRGASGSQSWAVTCGMVTLLFV